MNKLKEIKNNNEKEILELKKNKKENENEIEKLKEEKDNNENENKKLSLFLDDAKKTISEKDTEINNMKNNYENLTNSFNKKTEEYNKENLELKEMLNILESLIIKEKQKFAKLFSLAKEKIDILNKEKMIINEEIIILKNKNNENKNEKEKKYNYEIIKENNKYEKKIIRLNKIICELKERIQILYKELSNKQNK